MLHRYVHVAGRGVSSRAKRLKALRSTYLYSGIKLAPSIGMSTTTLTLPLNRRARTRREASRIARALSPPPVLAKARAEEDTRGWFEIHFKRLVAFVGSAAIAAAFVSHLLPARIRTIATRTTVAIPSAVVGAPAEAEVPVPVPAQVAIPAPMAPPPELIAQNSVAKPVTPSRRHTKARSYRSLAHAAEARTEPRQGAIPSVARGDYLRGDLESAEQLLRSAARIGQANRVASVARSLAEAQSDLRQHDEAAATRALDATARADRTLAFGAGKISRDVGRQLGNLHLAAGLRAQRAGRDAVAHKEFEAAHRADPSNGRATAELQTAAPTSAPDDVASVQDAIDPD